MPRVRQQRYDSIAFATGNAGKQNEWAEFLADFAIEFPKPPDVVEDGWSYAANSVKKSQAAARALRDRYPASLFAAEDAGLEVPALNGLPGIHSARFALCAVSTALELTPPPDSLPSLPDQNLKNNELLLELLERHGLFQKFPDGVPARYTAVISLADAEATILNMFEAHLEVTVVKDAHYEHGFGYDAITVEPKFGHMGKLPVHEKNTFSHRAQALRQLCRWLEETGAVAGGSA